MEELSVKDEIIGIIKKCARDNDYNIGWGQIPQLVDDIMTCINNNNKSKEND